MDGFGERPKFWISEQGPLEATDKEISSKNIGMSSMNAVSFGFVATAIFISMFLVMAIFEHLLRPKPSYLQSATDDARGSFDAAEPHAQLHWFGKSSSSQQSVVISNSPDVSVLMPGHHYPTYLAQPSPLPCIREGIHWPSHDHLQ